MGDPDQAVNPGNTDTELGHRGVLLRPLVVGEGAHAQGCLQFPTPTRCLLQTEALRVTGRCVSCGQTTGIGLLVRENSSTPLCRQPSCWVFKAPHTKPGLLRQVGPAFRPDCHQAACTFSVSPIPSQSALFCLSNPSPFPSKAERSPPSTTPFQQCMASASQRWSNTSLAGFRPEGPSMEALRSATNPSTRQP